MGSFYERNVDPHIVEAISPDIHKLLSNEGPVTYLLPKNSRLSINAFLEQILASRITTFKSPDAQDIMAREGRFNADDYINFSTRASIWAKKHMTQTARDKGVGDDCVQSLLYPRQLFADSVRRIRETHAFLCHTLTSGTIDVAQTQATVTKTINYVEPRLSLMVKFRDSLKDLRLEDKDHSWMMKEHLFMSAIN